MASQLGTEAGCRAQMTRRATERLSWQSRWMRSTCVVLAFACLGEGLISLLAVQEFDMGEHVIHQVIRTFLICGS